MDDLYKFTRIILIVLGVYFLLTLGMTLCITLPNQLIYFGSYYKSHNFLQLIAPVFSVIYLVLIILLLLCRVDKWTTAIVKPVEQDGKKQQISLIPVAFRLVAVFTGIFYLYQIIPTIVSDIIRHISWLSYVETAPRFHLEKVFNWVIILALGVYLLCGAPHFVRWQVKKTLELAGKIKENTVDIETQ